MTYHLVDAFKFDNCFSEANIFIVSKLKLNFKIEQSAAIKCVKLKETTIETFARLNSVAR